MNVHHILFVLSKKYRNNKFLRIVVLPFWVYLYKIRRKKSIKAFRRYGDEVIRIIYQDLNPNTFPIWLEFGTLLGAYRNNDFISYDIDIDLGTYLEVEKKIDSYLKERGFILVREFKVDSGKIGLERTYLYKGVFVDVFYFIKESNNMYTYGFEKDVEKGAGYLAYKYEFNNSGLKKASFKDIIVLVPSDTQEHLEAQYGKDFMIPDPNYSDKDAPNRKEILEPLLITYEEFH